MIRYGIQKYSDEVGNFWVLLADIQIKLGLFEKARDIFEEALETVLTSRDFGIIFNAYVHFEEEMINLMTEEENEEIQRDEKLLSSINKALKLTEAEQENYAKQVTVEDEIDLKLFRLESLLLRRPLLLSSCLLRQNKNNVKEWLNRIELLREDKRMLLKTFNQALEQIEPEKAENGLLSEIWYL